MRGREGGGEPDGAQAALQRGRGAVGTQSVAPRGSPSAPARSNIRRMSRGMRRPGRPAPCGGLVPDRRIARSTSQRLDAQPSGRRQARERQRTPWLSETVGGFRCTMASGASSQCTMSAHAVAYARPSSSVLHMPVILHWRVPQK
eukprot:351253-Chlamydomonas_euryale.AAC.8